VRTIALSPLRVHPDVAEHDAARGLIEAAVAARLGEDGFTVVGSDAVLGAWRDLSRTVGNVFDPITGAADPGRYEVVEAGVYRELGRRRVDAVLYLRVEPVDVYLPGTTVHYCGAEDPIYWPDGGLGDDAATLARAACLIVTVYDLDRRQLYAIRSGIEPFETYARQTRATLPPAMRLRDAARIDRAVAQALAPLAGVATR
jgi:hypothetical protein